MTVTGAVLVQNSIASDPLQQTRSVQVYAARALEAGLNTYLTAINTNPNLAQCSTATNGSGTCAGLSYETWTQVEGSGTSGSDPEYYSFGNPQPTFNTVTGALNYLTVEIVGATYDINSPNNYIFQNETITVSPQNAFLNHVWWSNYESFNDDGDYTNCNYNWKDYNIDNDNYSCNPVYFGNSDVVNGPIYTNDSVFIDPSNAPGFGTTGAGTWPGPTSVQTADPKCLFVTDNQGMSGSSNGCNQVAANDVTACSPVSAAQYVSAATPQNSGSSNCQDDTLLSPGSSTSSFANPVEVEPAADTELGTLAGLNGCLYAGPTQVTLNGTQMTVVSPDTPSSGGFSTLGQGAPVNNNQCPVNGTSGLPANGIVYAETAPSGDQVAWSNPFDDPVSSTFTNVTSSPAPAKNTQVTLTATVTPTDGGGTVAFTEATTNFGHTTTTNISGCGSQSLGTVTSHTATATCTVTLPNSTPLPTLGATYSGDNSYTTSSGVYGTTSSGTSTISYGPDSQVQSQCNGCYYGQTASNDSEADVFVNGNLSGDLTIASQDNIIIDGNITYDDCSWLTKPGGTTTGAVASESYCAYNNTTGSTNDVLGLIANNYVEVNQPVTAPSSQGGQLLPSCGGTPGPLCNPGPETSSGSVTIDAAVLALNQSFVVNNYSMGNPEGRLIVYGSIEQYARGPVAIIGSSGYSKNYTWDPLLPYVSPPSYLVPTLDAWILSSTGASGVAATATSCPSLPAPSNSMSGPTTAYCGASPGGLPSYG
jgi:hypothetical protein